MRGSVRLLFAPAWILASVVLVGSAFAQTAPKVVSASQSACPDTIRDVDRIACWVSAPPAPVPGAGPKPAPALLRGSDGTTIIGPKPSQQWLEKTVQPRPREPEHDKPVFACSARYLAI